jgi:hypothetical protein
MSNIHFRTAPGILPIDALGKRQTQHGLIVGPGGMIPSGMHRASIDTLTLSLRPSDHILVGFDAYTNSEKWERRELTVPDVDHAMALQCTETFDEHGIGPSGGGPVRYVYSESTSLLLIGVADGPSATRIRGLSCGILGLGAEGELVEIWVQNFQFQ